MSDELVTLIMAHIGDLDPELRDDIIYFSWEHLLRNQRLTVVQKRWLLEQASEKLFWHLGEIGDSVFTRSFASLLLAKLTADHLEVPWLTDDESTALQQRSIAYMQQERDHRGYIEPSGWAHAFAHGADLLKQAVRLPHTSAETVAEMLACIQRGLFEIGEFLYGEEERLARVVIQMAKEALVTDESCCQWLQKMQGSAQKQAGFPNGWLQFLKAAYFMLTFEELAFQKSQAEIEACLKIYYEKYQII